MKLNGSEIIIECLKEQGVDTVFGYPGGAILNVYDALYKHSDEITHILTSHEQGASHAADGYARATGKVGVCFATSGPGATNLVTGIATAAMDSIPIVAITCNVTVPLLGKDSFQEVDIAGITMPITKHSFIVKDVNKLADTIRRAFTIAKEGRPGPVLVDITKDVTANECDYVKTTPKTIERVTDTIKEEDIVKAVNMIKEAKKPVVFAGGGAIASDASDELRRFVNKVDAPVVDSLMGKGAFDGTDPRYAGMLGMHGTKAANYSVTECDLLIVVGARFSDRVTGNTRKFANNAKILQFDVDAAEINKNIRTDASVIGDALEILKRINALLDQCNHSEWIQHVEELKADYPMKYNTDRLNGPLIMEKIFEVTGGDAIISTDVGQHQMWVAQHYKFEKPRTFVSSGGLGTMGFGLGAAIGSYIATEKPVVLFTGDGSFGMNLNELATAVSCNAPVIVVIMNNGVLGMVRQWQTLFFNKHYSNTTLCRQTDFVKLAEAFGALGFRAENTDELSKALDDAIAAKRPVVIDCKIDKDEFVLPMLPPGGSIDDIITEIHGGEI